MFDPVKSILSSIANDPNVSPEFAKAVCPVTGEDLLTQLHGKAQTFAFWHKVRTVIFDNEGTPDWMTQRQFDASGYDVEPIAVYDTDGEQCY